VGSRSSRKSAARSVLTEFGKEPRSGRCEQRGILPPAKRFRARQHAFIKYCHSYRRSERQEDLMVSRCFLGWCAISVALSWQTPSAGAVQETLIGDRSDRCAYGGCGRAAVAVLSAGHGPRSCCCTATPRPPAVAAVDSRLAANFTVIASRLAGSAAQGFDERSGHDARREPHSRARKKLGVSKAAVVGHDIGLMSPTRMPRSSRGGGEARAHGCISAWSARVGRHL